MFNILKWVYRLGQENVRQRMLHELESRYQYHIQAQHAAYLENKYQKKPALNEVETMFKDSWRQPTAQEHRLMADELESILRNFRPTTPEEDNAK